LQSFDYICREFNININMNKIFLSFLVMIMPLCMSAQNYNSSIRQYTGKHGFYPQQEDAAYLAGAVTERDGKVVFTETIAAPGKTKDQIYAAAAGWVSLRFAANAARSEWDRPDFFKNTEYAQLRSADKAAGSISCQGSEEMVFRSAALVKDYCNANYIIDLQAKDGSMDVTIKNIQFIYTGSQSELMPAEEYITDAECFSKKGTLQKPYAKFRVRFIDLKYDLIKELTEILK